MGFFSRLLGAGGNDSNAPSLVVSPKWGPDGYSDRMAVLNMLRGNAFSPANIGPGVRSAPPGSSTEGTKTNAWMSPQQNFKGMAARMGDPSSKTINPVPTFPATNVQLNPVLFAMGSGTPSNWSNWNGGVS
jgi:hypothetical protein